MKNKRIETSFESFINSNDFKNFSDKSLSESLRYDNIDRINEGIIRDAIDSVKSLIRRGLNTVKDYADSIALMLGGIKNKIINTTDSLFRGTRVIEVFDSKNGDMISQVIERYSNTPAMKQWNDFVSGKGLTYPINEAVTPSEIQEEQERLSKILTTPEFRKEGYDNPDYHTGAKTVKSVNELMNILKDAFEITIESKLEKGSGVRAVVPYILGAPAIGKTALVSKFVEEVGGVLVELKLGSLLPSDLKGLPYVDVEGAINMALQKELETNIDKYSKEFKIDVKTDKIGATSNFAIPNLGFPIVSRKTLDSPEYREIFNRAGIGKDGIRPIIVYIDEFVQADKEVIDRANQFIQQGNVTGEEFTAPHVFIIVTSNRPQDNPESIGSAPFWGSGALKDRFTFLDFIPNAQDWIDWATKSNQKLLSKYGGEFSIKDIDKMDSDKVRRIGDKIKPKNKPYTIHPDILEWFQDMDPNYEERDLYKENGSKVVYREQLFYQAVKFGGVAPSPRRWEELSDWYTNTLWKYNIDSVFDMKYNSSEYKSLMDEIKSKFVMKVGVIAYAEWEKFVDTRMSLDTKNIDLALTNPTKAKLQYKFLDVVAGGGKTKNLVVEYLLKTYLYKKSKDDSKKYLEYALNLAIYFMRHGSGSLFSKIFEGINNSKVVKHLFGVPESVNIEKTSVVKYYTTTPTWAPQATSSPNWTFDNEYASVDSTKTIGEFEKSVTVKDTSRVWVNPVTGTPYVFSSPYMRENANDPKLVEKGFYLTSTNLLLRTGKWNEVPGIKLDDLDKEDAKRVDMIELDDNGCYIHNGDRYFCEVYAPAGILDSEGNPLPLNDIDKVRAHVTVYKNDEIYTQFEMNKKVILVLMSSVF